MKQRLLILLVLVVALGVCRPASATITQVTGQEAHSGISTSTGSVTITFAGTTTTHNLIICGVSGQSNTTYTMSNGGDTPHQAGTRLTKGSNFLDIWYFYDISHTQTTVTNTYGVNVTYSAMACREFTGFGSGYADPFGAAAKATGTSTAPNTGSITAGSSSVIFAFGETDNAGWVAGSGYSLQDFAVTNDATKYFASEYHVVSASESATATVTSGAWGITGASFNAPSAGCAQAARIALLGVGGCGG